MAITCTENIDSRQITEGQSAELIYTITGTADEAAAIATLKATAPTVLHNMKRQPVTVEPVHIDTTHPDKCICGLLYPSTPPAKKRGVRSWVGGTI
ncbi:MAG: hypothetical protein DIU65_15680 [Proteobacteria bacterium]|nr:MAG: hypothetical protein DIU65_15680 [Pseudomonadota bacterium]